jgi:hypothetical protein
VFVALAFTPIVTCLQPARGEMDAPGPRPSTVRSTQPARTINPGWADPRDPSRTIGPRHSLAIQLDSGRQLAHAGRRGVGRLDFCVKAVDPEIIALLKNSALNDSDPRVREEAVASLVTIENDQATEALLQLLDDGKEDRTKVFILRTLSRRRSK